MRKFQKRQILDIIDKLHILHKMCEDELLKEEYQNAVIQTGGLGNL